MVVCAAPWRVSQSPTRNARSATVHNRTLLRKHRMTPIRETAKLVLDAGISWKQKGEVLDRELLVEALERTRGNMCRAARILQMHRNTVTRQLDRLQLRHLPRKLREANRQQPLAFMRKPPEGIWVDAQPKRRKEIA